MKKAWSEIKNVGRLVVEVWDLVQLYDSMKDSYLVRERTVSAFKDYSIENEKLLYINDDSDVYRLNNSHKYNS